MQTEHPSRNARIRPLQPFTPFPAEQVEQSITQRFDQQVRAHGDRLAVQGDRGSVRFADLDRISTGLALTILSLCRGGAEPIALLFDHGAAIVASILGVLKTGKFHVVLDTSYPHERLKFLLADSGAKLIVTDGTHLELARRLSDEATAILDVTDHVERPSTGSLDICPSADALAMIIYTSGSTGRPKGVMHTHRTVLADVRNVTNDLGISAHDRWLWHTSVGFAGSARTLYSALLNGSTVYPFDSRRQGFGELAAWVRRHEITIFRTVPTTFRAFMATLPTGLEFPSVRVLSMGGEPLFRTDVADFNRHFLPHSVLVHPFGPTECMAVCWNVIPNGQQITAHKVPIGYALPDKTVLLLDASGRQVADEETGEIAVKSRHLSPGYWRDPGRTNAAFLRDESGGDEPVYLTGDLGTRSKDGCLMHMGRLDFQVKIRGYRVEVSEIETVLREIDGIGEAVVVGQPGDSGESRLVAYFVPTTRPAMTVTEIRGRLAQVLPDYMVPSIFVAMEALPRTPSGKTDRLHLPYIGGARPEMATPFTPPGTRTETLLAEIWADTLGLDRVGIHDDFFVLGGDSLQLLKLLSRIEQTFHTSLSLKDLSEASTIAGQSARVVDLDRRNAPTRASLVEVRGPADALEASRPPLIVSPSLFGHIDEWRELVQGAVFDRAVFGVEFNGKAAYPKEHATLEDIVSDVADVVAERFPDRPVHLAGHSFGAHVAYELGQQLRARALAPLSVVLVDANASGPDRPIRLADVVSMAANLPRWLAHEWRIHGPSALWNRIMRRWRSQAAISAAIRVDPALADEDRRTLNLVMRTFDWPSLPTLYRRRLLLGYSAVKNYRPRPTENRVVYLRSRVRSVIHRHRPDGGWGQYVPAGSLHTYTIPGDHGGALHVRWRPVFLSVLREALGAAT